jgi:putative transposase
MYNTEHRHGGIGLLTPATVHYGQAEAVRARRADVLAAAYVAHPERFVRRPPQVAMLPSAVWINPPKPADHAAATPSPPSAVPAEAPGASRIDPDEGGRYLAFPQKPTSAALGHLTTHEARH